MSDSNTSEKLFVNPCTSATSNQKWMISAFSGLLYAIIASNAMYKFTGGLLASKDQPFLVGEGVSTFGLITHAVVFALLVRVSMW